MGVCKAQFSIKCMPKRMEQDVGIQSHCKCFSTPTTPSGANKMDFSSLFTICDPSHDHFIIMMYENKKTS